MVRQKPTHKKTISSIPYIDEFVNINPYRGTTEKSLH